MGSDLTTPLQKCQPWIKSEFTLDGITLKVKVQLGVVSKNSRNLGNRAEETKGCWDEFWHPLSSLCRNGVWMSHVRTERFLMLLTTHLLIKLSRPKIPINLVVLELAIEWLKGSNKKNTADKNAIFGFMLGYMVKLKYRLKILFSSSWLYWTVFLNFNILNSVGNTYSTGVDTSIDGKKP